MGKNLKVAYYSKRPEDCIIRQRPRHNGEVTLRVRVISRSREAALSGAGRATLFSFTNLSSWLKPSAASFSPTSCTASRPKILSMTMPGHAARRTGARRRIRGGFRPQLEQEQSHLPDAAVRRCQ